MIRRHQRQHLWPAQSHNNSNEEQPQQRGAKQKKVRGIRFTQKKNNTPFSERKRHLGVVLRKNLFSHVCSFPRTIFSETTSVVAFAHMEATLAAHTRRVEPSDIGRKFGCRFVSPPPAHQCRSAVRVVPPSASFFVFRLRHSNNNRAESIQTTHTMFSYSFVQLHKVFFQRNGSTA